MKRLLCNTLIIIMLMGVCFNGCFDFGGLSVPNRFSYAAADNWSACDSSDLVTAFRYYCKSRNLALEGSAADALTTFTTTTFNNLCSTLGIDPTQLQAELKKTTEGNLGLRFLFSNTGITAYNRLFAEFLQNNDLSVGDEVDNKTLFDGKSYNGSLIWVFSGAETSNLNGSNFESRLITKGSYYKYSESNCISMSVGSTIDFPEFNFSTTKAQNVNYTYTSNIKEVNTLYFNFANSTYSWFYGTYKHLGVLRTIYGGYPCIVYFQGSNSYDLDLYTYRTDSDGETLWFQVYAMKRSISLKDEPEDADIYITTNNKTINNNNYNNNWTIVYNDGDTYIDNDDPEPPANTPPGGGGGGNPSDPDPEDPLAPYDPDKQFPDSPDNPTPDPGVHGSPGSDGTITFPDFNFDVPEINWSLDGLQHKFPFSLPFDLYNACKLLNAEPETPELDYTIDLVVYDWRVNYDLHWLDPAARVIRIFELLAFVVGLILITRRLIGG